MPDGQPPGWPSSLRTARGLLTAEPDARGDRDERRLRRVERLRNVHIPRLEEQRGSAYRVGQAHPYVPGELGLGRVGGDAPGRDRKLHVVNTDPADQVARHPSRRPPEVVRHVRGSAKQLDLRGRRCADGGGEIGIELIVATVLAVGPVQPEPERASSRPHLTRLSLRWTYAPPE